MENLIMFCTGCQGRGRICLDDYIGLNVDCGSCHGKGAMVWTGEQLLSDPPHLEAWLKRTGLRLHLRAEGDTIHAFVQGDAFECHARATALAEAVATALDNATAAFLTAQAQEAA